MESQQSSTNSVSNQIDLILHKHNIKSVEIAEKKIISKPKLSSSFKKGSMSNQSQPIESHEVIINKLSIYYKYRIASIYRQLKIPIYDELVANSKTKDKQIKKPSFTKNSKTNPLQNVKSMIEMLYKFVNLNSKYHHRQKVRFSRTSLFKYIKYDFAALRERMQNKKFHDQLYGDLQQSDKQDDDNQKDMKFQYYKNDQFSKESISIYQKKHQIAGPIIITQGYDDLKAQLIEKHGWSQNNQNKSLIYHLKFMSKKKDIDYVNLLDFQIVNHFQENKCITAKFGLCRNLKNLVYMGGDFNGYFPRCYDVNDVIELQNFYEDFKISESRRILNDFVRKKGNIISVQNIKSSYLFSHHQKQVKLFDELMIKEKFQSKIQIVKLALNISQLNQLDFEKKLDMISKGKQIYVTMDNWEELKLYFYKSKRKLTQPQKQRFAQKMIFLDSQEFRKKLENFLHQKIVAPQITNLLKQAQQHLQYLSKTDKQYHLNHSQNTWIVKPASMSRGRGIKTFNNINQILDYIAGKEISWVVQKYIERPLVIRKRKFDIRQWVIVTDFKPLRVWIYDQRYVRFCAEQYDPQNLKNRKVHLTNNSVTKGITNIKQDDGIKQNMWSQVEFAQQIGKLTGEQEYFKKKIVPQIIKICIETFKSIRQNIIPRKNTFQLFGYDFMIDQWYNVWLIEVNSSPSMQYSTKITQKIVKKGLRDIADLVVKYMMNNKIYKQDIGGWKLVCGK